MPNSVLSVVPALGCDGPLTPGTTDRTYFVWRREVTS